MLAGLPLIAESSFEFPIRRSDHKDSAVGHRGARDHIFDKVAMTRRVDDGELALRILEL